MSRSQRRCYAQLRAEAAEATAQVDLPAPSMLSFTRRVVVREQPSSEVVDQPPVYIPEEPSVAPSASAGYRPADYRSESEDEMSPGSSRQDWLWHSDDDAPDFLVELAPDRSAPALPAQAASASGESHASVSRTEEQSGVGEAVAASSPEAQPQCTSSDDAGGHAAVMPVLRQLRRGSTRRTSFCQWSWRLSGPFQSIRRT
jgi:hypothetical protein